MKRYIQSLNRIIHRSLFSKPLPRAAALYFHSLEESNWDSFRECISYWCDLGYREVGPLEFSAAGEKTLYVSFDDNYRSWHSSLGVLDDLSIKATFFVNTLPFRDLAEPATISEYFDRIDHHSERISLSTAELQEIAAAGHTVGCHTHSHFNMRQLSTAELPLEVGQSREILEELLGQPIVHFSYPFGMRRFFSEPLRRYCTEQGFQTVSNAIPGMLYHQQRRESLHRSPWNLEQTLEYNLANVRIDGRLFERVTGRSAVV